MRERTDKKQIVERLKNTKEETKNQLQNELEDYKTQLEILQSIKIQKKKDGKYFQSILKNFKIEYKKPLEIKRDSYSNDFVIYYYTDRLRQIYIDSETHNKEKVEQMKQEDPTRIIKSEYFRNKYIYNVPEIMNEIQERIIYIKTQMIEYNYTLITYDRFYEELEKIGENIGDFLDRIPYQIYYKFKEKIRHI